MELWLVIVLYVVGLGMIIAETMMPGIVLGLVGSVALTTSVVLGFRHHWAVGTGQVLLVVVVVPIFFFAGIRRLRLKSTIDSGAFAEDYSRWLGREGEALTDLRPAGMILFEGRKVDVVTAGELIGKGKRVKVVKVEGNRIVVREVV